MKLRPSISLALLAALAATTLVTQLRADPARPELGVAGSRSAPLSLGAVRASLQQSGGGAAGEYRLGLDDYRTRINYIERSLDAGRARALRWRRAWIAGFAGMTLGQLGIIAFAEEEDFRVHAMIGGTKTTAGVIIMSLRPGRDTQGFDPIRDLDDATPEERRLKLYRAERWLQLTAAEQEQDQGFRARIISSMANLAGAYIMWLGFERFDTGWIAVLSGLVVSETRFETRPTHAIGAWNAYQRRYLPLDEPVGAAPAPSPLPGARPGMLLVPTNTGVALRGAF